MIGMMKVIEVYVNKNKKKRNLLESVKKDYVKLEIGSLRLLIMMFIKNLKIMFYS